MSEIIANYTAVDKVVNEYVDNYEYEADEDISLLSEPEQKRAIILDAIQGLLAEPDFLKAMQTWLDSVRRAQVP